MMELKRIDWKSTAKVFGLVYGALGAIIGLIYMVIIGAVMLIGLVGTGDATTLLIGLVGGIVIGVIILVLAAVLYGLIGVLAGALMAVVYNYSAKYVGGIKLDLKPAKK